MPYAVMQQRLEKPDPAALERAFRGIEGLHPSDAPNLAADAFGILVKGLSESAGRQLVAALAGEGIDVELMNEASLPALPPAKKVRRARCRSDAFITQDPYDRELVIPWDRIEMVCAGEVRLSQFRPAVLYQEPAIQDPESGWASFMPSLTVNTEERNWCWIADLVLTGGELRFSLQAAEFLPLDRDGPGSRAPAVRFQSFLGELLKQVPEAVVNRGAFALREGDASAGPRYPTRNAYQEELIWLLWRLGSARRC